MASVGRPAKPLTQLVREGAFRARRHAELLPGPDLAWDAFAALQQKYRACVEPQERYSVALEFEQAVRAAQRLAREQAAPAQPAQPTKPKQESKPVVSRLALSPDEAADALGVSRDFFDEHIACELPIIRRGRRKLVPIRALERWLSEQASSALETAR
jgi:hypothetical protein